MKSEALYSCPSGQDARKIRERVYESLGRVASAFASPARLKMVQLLSQAHWSVEELAKETGESVANTSQHLQRLAKAGVVSSERRGVSRIYRVSSSRVSALWSQFQELGHELDRSLDEDEHQLTDASLRAPESAESVLNSLRRGQVILLDVRFEKEALATSVPGAVAIPLSELSKPKALKMLKLAKSKTVYVFCRGRYCPLATSAVKILRSSGYKAFRLRESAFQLKLIQGGRA